MDLYQLRFDICRAPGGRRFSRSGALQRVLRGVDLHQAARAAVLESHHRRHQAGDVPPRVSGPPQGRPAPPGAHRRLREHRLQPRHDGIRPRRIAHHLPRRSARLRRSDSRLRVEADRSRNVARTSAACSPRCRAKNKKLLTAVFLEERPADEVCDEMGIDRGYLRVLLFRARTQLRDAVNKTNRASGRSGKRLEAGGTGRGTSGRFHPGVRAGWASAPIPLATS